jgi:hypothetical protein
MYAEILFVPRPVITSATTSLHKMNRVQEKGSVEMGEKQTDQIIPTDENELLTAQERRRLTWKLDIRLLPCIWLIYFSQMLPNADTSQTVNLASFIIWPSLLAKFQCSWIAHLWAELQLMGFGRIWVCRFKSGDLRAYSVLGITGTTYNVGISLFYIVRLYSLLNKVLILRG